MIGYDNVRAPNRLSLNFSTQTKIVKGFFGDRLGYPFFACPCKAAASLARKTIRDAETNVSSWVSPA
jgi:hypothetical protein